MLLSYTQVYNLKIFVIMKAAAMILACLLLALMAFIAVMNFIMDKTLKDVEKYIAQDDVEV